MKIFWSWQSDNHQKSGRYFVRDVLNALATELNALDGTEEAERGEDTGPVEVDHDTKNIGGSPPIAETILQKISEAAVFVADVTPVGQTEGGKQLANPNVMIELGYAIHALGHQRIVLVMNKAAHVQLDTLPFDLRHWRSPVVYELAENASPELKKEQKDRLKAELRIRIKPSLEVAANAELQKRRLAYPRPMFGLELQTVNSNLPATITQQIGELGVPLLEEIKTTYPKRPVPTVDPEHVFRPSATARSMGFYSPPPPDKWTRKETETYNEKLDSFYVRYDGYLVALAKHRRLQLRTLNAVLKLDNSGTAPGTDIDVEILVPDGVLLFKPTELPEPPRRPEPPPLDPSPVIRGYPQSPQWVGGDFHSPEANAWTRVDPETRTVRYHVKKLKHGYSRKSEEFALVFETEQNIGDVEIPFDISANESPEATTGYVKLEVVRVDD